MSPAHAVIRQARECHTRAAWAKLFQEHKDSLAQPSDPRLLEEVFKLLKQDPQNLVYPKDIWITLLQGSLFIWNLELGREIACHTMSIPSCELSLLNAEIYLQSGLPATARKTAQRAHRFKNISTEDKLRLQMIICNSYVEEGKVTLAKRQLDAMERVLEPSLKDPNLADLITNMGRAQFFLGHYLKAARLFQTAVPLYKDSKSWQLAAKALFNAAACYHNSGQKKEEAFLILAECRSLALEKNLEGVSSHCYAFHGTVAYQQGDFLAAEKAYQKALQQSPERDDSFRTLHILSMRSLANLKMGKLRKARQLGDQTFQLAAKDESQRFQARYANLEAELLWQEGNIEESQNLLEGVLEPLKAHGVTTLEELSAASRYLLQCSYLGISTPYIHLKLKEPLLHATHSQVEFLLAKAQIHLVEEKYSEALKLAQEAYQVAKEKGTPYLTLQSLLVLSQIKLASSQIDAQFYGYLRILTSEAPRFREPHLNLRVLFLTLGSQYQTGDPKKILPQLSGELKNKGHSAPDRFLMTTWIQTLKGHSPKRGSRWQEMLLSHATKSFFSPSVTQLSKHEFAISSHYLVDLKNQPLLFKLLDTMIHQPDHKVSSGELFQKVWEQSLNTTGWEQKVRNTLMRLRDHFPLTMAPLILHSDHMIRLNDQAISIIAASAKNQASLDQEIIQLLTKGPMTTSHIANHIQRSKATLKRAMKKLSDQNKIVGIREGRRIYYQATSATGSSLDHMEI